MAKILLLDFDDSDRGHLVAEKYDVELRSTGWRSGKEEPLDIPAESEIVFYHVNGRGGDGRSQLHAEVQEALSRRVEGGARVVCFISGGEVYQLTNIVGPLERLQLQDVARPDSILFSPRALFHVPFERFKPFISKAYKLLPEAAGEGIWEKASGPEGKLEILAKSADGYPVSLLMGKGKGSVLLLPSFGPKNVEIIDYILKDKTPFTAEPVAETGAGPWIEHEDYLFPDLKGLFVRKEEEKHRHELALAEIDREIREMKAGGQDEYHKLLTAEGTDLSKAVVNALRYLGWGKVVDVNNYWKKVIRNKEEDVWLIENDGPSVEANLRKESLILVLVRAGKAWATDDECALLQKYKGRRMQEFDNTRMKAVLIGNYFSATDAKARSNPFSAVQIEEAQKDGNGLLTSYELFKAIKAEKESRITKADVRSEIRDKTGLVTIDY
ncbi:MAG: hypothetical protein ABSG73_07015 [Candidatus Aminicenantales bacterium]|jgi:hypothetical protein